VAVFPAWVDAHVFKGLLLQFILAFRPPHKATPSAHGVCRVVSVVGPFDPSTRLATLFPTGKVRVGRNQAPGLQVVEICDDEFTNGSYVARRLHLTFYMRALLCISNGANPKYPTRRVCGPTSHFCTVSKRARYGRPRTVPR
jgi:hypothetical protein